ncbi:cysteine desulfurase [Luteolibacter pohnpeiensis]|uniref:cysteine desulfurase n=1 Tax=Luteolibacter pohnpeiensis TaxID=454153 RepID=A0A934S2C8_9BACT|nr:cysteine desulfurase family protein [Luteolibacter pohnpeiensis]MBK1881141.1 cysteine desulfurase [Luteolibacter pohnpeiensis]
MIHLDANATTPLLPEVLDAMLPWLRDGFANPSGAYASAKLARKAIDQARRQVADLIGAEPSEILFTSGGTESVNTALHSLDRLTGEGHAVVSAIEHSAVLRYAESLQREVKLAPVDADGRVNLTAFAELLDGAAFVSIMTANNETGVIQPIAEMRKMAAEKGLPFHSDAIQAAGKMPIDVKATGVDLLSLSAHKFHGPKGMGALYVRKGLRFMPLLRGGGQEDGRRSGTENTASIVAMGVAAAFAAKPDYGNLDEMRNAFEKKVMEQVAGVTVNGSLEHRLPNTSHLSFDGCEAAGLLILLDEAGVACSAGSACMTGKQKPSHVQLAMGIDEARAKSSLRFSFSKLNTMEQAQAAADQVKRAVEKLRRIQGSGVGPVVVYSP